MTNSIYKLGSKPTQNLIKKGVAMLMLVVLAHGSPASAKIAPEDVLTPTMVAYQPQVAAVEPETQTPPTVQEVLLSVCQENGYGEDCAKTLLGMLWTESSNRSTVIGDNGAARGYFQIHYKLHNIPISCAEDLVCSAQWSLKYLESHSYPKYVTWAVQCHNSCGVNNGYAAKVFRNAKIFWDQPLTIEQAAPITIAMQ
jgi:hypothetical protein